MDQFTEITAYRCMKCGNVLTTPRGATRHAQTCQYVPVQCEGQISFRGGDEENDAIRTHYEQPDRLLDV